ncbi:hypothetical protein BH11PAT2_BH11PAT2_07900 [soil metagenome]
MQSKHQKAPPYGLTKDVIAAVIVALPSLSDEHAKAFLAASGRKRNDAAKAMILSVIGKTSFREDGIESPPQMEGVGLVLRNLLSD